LSQISPNLPLAVVASEDQKFPDHWGFDVEAIEKAYEMNQHSHRVHGASTISQQVAKNLFLWSGRSYLRKGLEAYFTVLIEACWPKRRILEIYLNIAEFGYGTYGAEAAGERFFHKPASKLSRSDSAVLAAVLPNPQKLLAAAPSAYVQQRRDWILGQMQALGGPEMLDEIDAYPIRRR
jgi:monofunctional biosynthetic peptidoglycan transglycosylase